MSGGRRAGPPALIEALLRRALPGDVRGRSILGDLREEHAARGERSRWRADLWFVVEAVRLAFAYGWPSRRRRARPSGATGTVIEGIGQDIRYAVRTFARRPGFTLVAVITLAFGTGASVAIFSVVNTVMLRPLPYEDPARLMLVWNRTAGSPEARGALSPPDLLDLREQSRLFEDFAGVNSFAASLAEGGDPEQLQLGVVTANFFSVLGVRPALGRDFTVADDTPLDTRDETNVSVVILGHELWQRRFGGDPDVLGRIMRFGGSPMEVIGVLPPEFELHMPADAGMETDLAAWTPLRIPYATAPRDGAYLKVIGRLAPGANAVRARAELDGIAERLRAEHPTHDAAGLRFGVAPLHGEVVGHVSPMLMTMMGAVLMVLLIACANVANLLLVRLSAREREITVRAALGAGAGRLARQLLVESLLLAGVGTAVGIGAAWAGIRLLLRLQPADIPRVEQVAIDGGTLTFAVVLTVAATVLFGLAPALLSVRPRLTRALGARGGSESGTWRRLREGFIVAEIALALVLVVGTGLMVRSLGELGRMELGFRPEGVITFRTALPFTAYRGPDAWARFYTEFERRLADIPGVRSVGSTAGLPMTEAGGLDPFALDPGIETQPWGSRTAVYRTVTPRYFAAAGIGIPDGRAFTETDTRETTPVVVIDRALADRLWPDGTGVGRSIVVSLSRFDGGYRLETVEAEVVGIARTTPHGRPDAASPGTIYVPFAQQPLWNMATLVSAEGDAAALLPTIRRELRAMDAGLPLFAVRTLDEVVSETTAPTRFAFELIGLFAFIALTLASFGLYGVIAYAVRQRRRELSIRLVLGAAPRSLALGLLGRGLALASVGVAVGLLTAAGLARLASGLVVGVSTYDPVSMAGGAVVLTLVAGLASFVPARRASALDPVEGLRNG